MLACAATLLGLVAYRPDLFFSLPTPDTIREQALAPSSTILDRNGRALYEIVDPHVGLHRPVALADIPLALRRAIIATEDASFYENPGVDARAILRALWINLRSGEIVSGGSTITQQLARNLLLGPDERYEKTWQRKLCESLLAYHMTRTLSKDEILTLYLDETYFGNMAYGVGAAAQAYFGKPVAQLDLAECALLAGLPQSPSAYNPLTHLAAAKGRQRVVLDLMVKAGTITPQQANLAHREPLRFASAPFAIEAPHFCMLVREELTEIIGEEAVRRGGLRVHTTLDLNLQRATEAHVRRHLAELNERRPDEPSHNVRNAAVIVLDPHDGAVRTMVGSPDYFDREIDGAVNTTLSLRQPGSAIKPLTYAAAFERGYSPATMISDVPSSFLTREGTPYVPINYDYRYHGPVLLRRALACSYNVVAVKLLDEIGIEALAKMAHRMGITTLNQTERQGLALTLGSCEVQLWQLTAAYATLANGGWHVSPYSIDYVEDSGGKVIYRARKEPPERVLDERPLDARIAYLITDILSDDGARIPAFGEGGALALRFPAAVKTGTTTEWRDNWTIGYSTELVVGVWVGNADNEPMLRVSGISGAAPIWNAVMRSAHRRPPSAFPRPPGMVEVVVCAESGHLPGLACPHRVRELFLAENVPRERCRMHRLIAFDAATGEVALSDCPEERRLLRRVTFWPPEALAWAEEQGLPLPPESDGKLALAPSGEGQPASPVTQGGRSHPHGGLRLSSPAPNSSYTIAPDVPARFQQLEVIVSGVPPLDTAGHAKELSLWIDGHKWHTWLAPPYTVLWPLSPGVHEFWVKRIDPDLTPLNSAPVRITVHPIQHVERTSP